MQQLPITGTWIDLFFIGILIYFILSNQGFIHTIIEILSFVFSLVAAYNLHKVAGMVLRWYLGLPLGISQAIGFFLVWFFAELIFSLLATAIVYKYFRPYFRHPANKIFGYILGAIRGLLLFLFFISLAFALPVRGEVKQAILQSHTGPPFVNLSQTVDSQIKSVFNDAITESLNFLTVKPGSSSTYDLGFKASGKNLTADSSSEAIMLDLVNRERTEKGLSSLVFDTQLREVARLYASQMFEHGFFSHTSEVDGSEPSDRVEAAGVEYLVVGENLAFAPDVYIAHQGLMNSEGHRKNILHDEFGHVGIGVIDGGVYGKMFVQVFKD